MNRFLITYDITEDKRRNRVCACLKGWGDHIQYSVFSCDLSPTQNAKVLAEVHDLIKHDEDQVLIFDLGPVAGRGANCVTSVGCPYGDLSRRAYIL